MRTLLKTSRFCAGAAMAFSFVMLLSVTSQARCGDQFAALLKQAPRSSKTSEGFLVHGDIILFEKQVKIQVPARWPDKVIRGRFKRISSFDKPFREKLKELKRVSAPIGGPQVEHGELIVTYKDGTQRRARFTSGHFAGISAEAQNKAVEAAGLFDHAQDIVSVVDIHTHPNRGRRTEVFFSEDDLVSYQSLKSQIEDITGRKIEYRAVLLPNCNDCHDVVLLAEI